MWSRKTSAPASGAPQGGCRRVGTLTFGIVLVVTGVVMLCAMFFPAVDFTPLLRLSPLVLVSLGGEVLWSLRRGSRIRYDWMGMLLCGVLTFTAISLFWYISYYLKYWGRL